MKQRFFLIPITKLKVNIRIYHKSDSIHDALHLSYFDRKFGKHTPESAKGAVNCRLGL